METIGDATLYNGDCMEVLQQVGPVDLLLTDPPFGVREEGWDLMDARQLWRFTARWATAIEAKRAAVFHPDKQARVFRDIFEQLYERTRTLVWDKPLGSQYAGAAEDGMWFAAEPILYCSNGGASSSQVPAMIREARQAANLSRGAVEQSVLGRRTGLCYRWEEGSSLPSKEHAAALSALLGLGDGLMRAIEEAARGDGQGRYRDVFSHRTVVGGVHPCEKPAGLMSELVDALSAPGWVVLDAFMGSGSTGAACMRLGRRFIGIERDPKHFDTARRRIEDAHNQRSLFPPEQPGAPEQLGLEVA